jgi:DNA-binding MarR family transcriptional regulator
MHVGDDILVALRKIMRAVELHSRQLAREYGLTGPQALVVREIQRLGNASVGELAAGVNLSQATTTDILLRLERNGLIRRERSDADRRRVHARLTRAGEQLIDRTPPLLQEKFTERLRSLEPWEQTQLLSSLQRIAAMMEAEEIDAAPLLDSGPVSAGDEDDRRGGNRVARHPGPAPASARRATTAKDSHH